MADRRRDEAGKEWTEAEVEAAVKAIVIALNGADVALTRRTSFTSLGWDRWFKLGLVAPVRRQLNEELAHPTLLSRVSNVGDLVKYIWSLMEPVAPGAADGRP